MKVLPSWAAAQECQSRHQRHKSAMAKQLTKAAAELSSALWMHHDEDAGWQQLSEEPAPCGIVPGLH